MTRATNRKHADPTERWSLVTETRISRSSHQSLVWQRIHNPLLTEQTSFSFMHLCRRRFYLCKSSAWARNIGSLAEQSTAHRVGPQSRVLSRKSAQQERLRPTHYE